MFYTPPYIPRADRHFRSMAEQFANGVSADPARYALAPAQAADIMQNFNRFNEAYMIATGAATRTRPAITAKDDARSILKNCISGYAALIRANLGVSDDDKIAIGIRPRNVAHNKRTCPQTSPLLSFLGSSIGFDGLFFTDTNTPESRAKPYSAAQLELHVAYSLPGQPQPNEADARYIGSFKKNPIRVPHDLVQDERGARPTYWARWQGFDGEVGPWSLPMSMAIAAEQASAQAAAKATTTDDDQSLKMAA